MPALPETELRQLTLDPEDWKSLRALGHRMVDDMLDHLATLRDQPAWQPLPDEVRRALRQPVPRQPEPAEAVYEEFLVNVLPYTSGNRHPRAWGWVRGNGTPLAMLADMLASGINAHLGGGEQAPTLVEEQALCWLAELMGMPGASGLLTSGGTMANLLGLAVARNARAGYSVREQGLQSGHPRLVVYGSSETHMWARKSVELLGLGSESLRLIPADEDSRIDLAALEAQIRADRRKGLRPVAVIGNAGTVNTGAIDDLPALASLCRREEMWFHVDGAFGALLRLSPRYAPLVRGIEQADSLAFDMHKWIYLPFEIGCLLVRDPAAHMAAFATPASYLEASERGMLAGGLAFSDRGIELTRGFKALKLWMSLKTHGTNTYAALIEQNMEQAAHLESLVRAHSELELLAPRAMNIVCFRYRPAGLAAGIFPQELKPLGGEAQDGTAKTVPLQEPGAKLASAAGAGALDRLNRELVLRLQESGSFIVSGAVLPSGYALRVANTNHRSRMEDFDALVRAVVALGRKIVEEGDSTAFANDLR